MRSLIVILYCFPDIYKYMSAFTVRIACLSGNCGQTWNNNNNNNMCAFTQFSRPKLAGYNECSK